MNAYKFCVDDAVFCLGRKSIESFGENCFTQMIDGKIEHTSEKVIFNPQSRVFFMDMDVDSVRYIVSLMRGYDINVPYDIKNKVERDLKILDIDYEFSDKLVGKSRVLLGGDLDKIEQYVNEMETKINECESFDMMNAISTDKNIIEYLKNKNQEVSTSESSSGSEFLDSSSDDSSNDDQNVSENDQNDHKDNHNDQQDNHNDQQNDNNHDNNDSDDKKYESIKIIEQVSQPNLSEYLSTISNTSKTTARYARLG